MICSFFLKLGTFPYHFWVIRVYTNIPNTVHLLMITVVNTGFLLGFNALINNILLKTITYTLEFFTALLTISALGSVLCGGLLLLTQTTVKGFFASTSIINTGFILLSYSAILNLSFL